MKCAIYVRLSEEDRNKRNVTDESESIQNQKSLLLNYAIEQGWEVYKIYCDEDYSGADRTRPDFNALIDEAKARKFDVVLCKTQARFSRDMEIIEKYLHHYFLEWKIRFVSLIDHADTADIHNKKSRQIHSLTNEWYLEDISNDVRRTFKNMHKEGKSTRSFMPYGYIKAPDNKNKAVIDEDSAVIVQQIFFDFMGGLSTSAITRKLNEQGVLAPYAYKKSKGMKFQMPKGTFGEGSLWTQQAVTRTLRNQMYAGDLIHGTFHKVSYKSKKSLAQPREKWEITPNTHEPIIERDMYDKVQTILDQRIKPRKGGEVHIFAKKVRCLDCGAPMHKYQRHLRCRLFERVKKSELCPHRPSIRIDKLEDIIAERIKVLFADIDNGEIANEFDFAIETENAIATAEMEFDKVEKELNKYAEYLQSIYKDKMDGVITNDDFAELKRGFMTEQERLRLQKTALLKRLSELGIKRLENQNKYAVVDKFKDFETISREMVTEFIDYIEIGKVENGEQEIKIHWEL